MIAYGISISPVFNLELKNNIQTASASKISKNHVNENANKIILPKGYTVHRVKYGAMNKLNKKQKRALQKASCTGMLYNQFVDKDNDLSRPINLTHLTYSQQKELSKYALTLINSARHQMHKRSWRLSRKAMQFANRVSKQYYFHNRSDWDSDHYVAGINKAAKQSGLKVVGQAYEDEGGMNMPVNTNMNDAKFMVYFNVKQMLFGGCYGSDSQLHQLNRYFEWEHAGDLLSLRNWKQSQRKYFGLSFSNLKQNPNMISSHFMSVDPIYINKWR